MSPLPFTFIAWTNHWVVLNGATYRDALVLRADGVRRIYSFLDGETA